MRLLTLLTAIPVFLPVYVAGEHWYFCSDTEGNTNTTYDQALAEKSVTDACFPDSELSMTELAANLEAKKYPQVWVDSEDYGFNETVLLWKFQGNITESQEGLNVLVFTDRACNVLGLVHRSEDHYTICESAHKGRDETAITQTLHQNARRFLFFDSDDENDDNDNGNDAYHYKGNTSDDPITLSPVHESRYEREHRQNSGWDYSRRVPAEFLPDPPATWQHANYDTSSIASTEYGTASQDFSSTYEDDSSLYNGGNSYGSHYQGSSSSNQRSGSRSKGLFSGLLGGSRSKKYLPATRDFPSTRDPPEPDLSRRRHSGWTTITPGPPTRPPPNRGYTMKPYRPTYDYGPDGTPYVPDQVSDEPPYISGEDHSYAHQQVQEDPYYKYTNDFFHYPQ